jgi:uncharacterized protein YndB with AHSA1/START domain
MLDGVFSKNADGGVLSFERYIDRPVDKVWAALTVPERVADWCGGGAEIDLRIGGVFRIRWAAEMGVVNGEITALQPPTLLEYSWHEPAVAVAASRVRWTLSQVGDGCRLKLEHIFPSIDPKSATEFAAGWDDIIRAIGRAADGEATPMDAEGQKQREAAYAAKFGIERAASTEAKA